jgi:hypothetical protein
MPVNLKDHWRKSLLGMLRRDEMTALSEQLNGQTMTRISMQTYLLNHWGDQYFVDCVVILAQRCGVRIYIKIRSE